MSNIKTTVLKPKNARATKTKSAKISSQDAANLDRLCAEAELLGHEFIFSDFMREKVKEAIKKLESEIEELKKEKAESLP